MKKCSKCNIEKELSHFYKSRTYCTLYRADCKECIRTERSTPEYKNKLNAKLQKQRLANPAKYWAQSTINQHKNRNKNIVNITWQYLVELANKSNICPLCKKVMHFQAGKKFTDQYRLQESYSLDRLFNQNELNANNICLICHQCNTMKSNRSLHEFVQYCSMILNNKCTILASSLQSIPTVFQYKDAKQYTLLFDNSRHIDWAKDSIKSHKAKYQIQFTWKDLVERIVNDLKCTFCCNDLYFVKGRGMPKDTSPSLDRIDNSFAMTLDNCMLLCHKCNSTKNSMSLSDFFAYCEIVCNVGKEIIDNAQLIAA